MNADEIRFLSYYLIPKDWNIHLVDQRTNEKQLEVKFKRDILFFVITVYYYLANSTNYRKC